MATVTQGNFKEFPCGYVYQDADPSVKYFDTHAHGDIMSTYTNDTDAIRMMVTRACRCWISRS